MFSIFFFISDGISRRIYINNKENICLDFNLRKNISSNMGWVSLEKKKKKKPTLPVGIGFKSVAEKISSKREESEGLMGGGRQIAAGKVQRRQMVSMATWFRYLASKIEYSISTSWKVCHPIYLYLCMLRILYSVFCF